jgi:type II secretory pathway component PulF
LRDWDRHLAVMERHPQGIGRAALAARDRALASAQLALSLGELLRAGTLLAPALTAIAAQRRQCADRWAPAFERIATAVREEGHTLFGAVNREHALFSPRFIAVLALAQLGGPLFRVFVERFRGFVDVYTALPPEAATDFPPMPDEIREFCFFLGHLIREKASQPEIQRWLPQMFTARTRLLVTLVLARFYDQGLLLSDAFFRTPPFNDAEMVLAVQAGEQRSAVGTELIELADWLDRRRMLEERVRMSEMVLPGLGSLEPGGWHL